MEEKKEKGKNSKRVVIAAAVVVCALLIAFGGIVIWQRGAGGPAAFDDYMDELFKENIVGNTVNLHYTLAHPENYGIQDYEISLGSFVMEDFEKDYKDMEAVKKRLLGFDKNELTREQQLTYDIVLDYVETELSVKDLTLYTEVLGPTTGYQSQLPVVLAEYTFRTQRDIEDYLALLSKVDEMTEQIIAFEKEKAKAGLFMSDYAADAIIGQCEEFISNPEENYMIDVFNDKIDAFEGLSEEEKESYREKNHAIITSEIVEAYQTLIDGLTALKGSGTNELGLCYYENGKEYYEYLLRSGTGSDLSVKKQKKRIEKFITDYFRSVYEVMSHYPDIYDALEAYEFPDMEPEAMLQDLTKKIEEDFPAPPEVDYTIKYVHPSMQEDMSPAFYLTTPIDDIQNNLIYINRKHLGQESEGGRSLYTTLAHEGYPGHLYQNACTASGNLPLVRSLFSFPGYAEGWATYVEFEYAYDYAGDDVAVESMFAGDKEIVADVLAGNEAVSLALLGYIDLGIHYDGWDREDMADYLADFGVTDKNTVDEFFDIIVEEPGNYLSYVVGYLEILDLREKAEEKLGEKFSAREFHEFLLEIGPAPFYVIEEYMEGWMEG